MISKTLPQKFPLKNTYPLSRLLGSPLCVANCVGWKVSIYIVITGGAVVSVSNHRLMYYGIYMVQLFDALITSKTWVRILMRLFLNPEMQEYLRELASKFEASPGNLCSELLPFSEAGILNQRTRWAKGSEQGKSPLSFAPWTVIHRARGFGNEPDNRKYHRASG